MLFLNYRSRALHEAILQRQVKSDIGPHKLGLISMPRGFIEGMV